MLVFTDWDRAVFLLGSKEQACGIRWEFHSLDETCHKQPRFHEYDIAAAR